MSHFRAQEYSVEYNGNKSCLYDSDLNSNNVNYLLELTYNNVKVFNIKNKLGLIFKVNNKSIVSILINNNLEQKYEIQNNYYRNIITNNNNLYLLDVDGTKIDNLSWS